MGHFTVTLGGEHYGFLDGVKSGEGLLHVAQLYAETVELHLEIEASQAEKAPLRIHIALVAGLVDAAGGAVGRDAGGEGGFGEVGPFPVAEGDGGALEVHFADLPGWKLLSCLQIADDGTHLGVEEADGEGICTLAQLPRDEDVRNRLGLGGTVGVVEGHAGEAIEDLLSGAVAQHLAAQNDGVERGEQLGRERRVGEAHLDERGSGDPFGEAAFLQSREGGGHGLLAFGLEGEEGIALGETGDDVEQAHVEGIRDAVEAHAVLAFREKALEVGHEGIDAARGHHDALGAPGASGGKEEIEDIVSAYAPGRVAGGILGDGCPQVVCAQHAIR